MKYIKLFESNGFKQYIPILKSIQSSIPLQNVIEYLNDTEIDYSHWSELQMYIYYITNSEE
jgi:hypothetical protein